MFFAVRYFSKVVPVLNSTRQHEQVWSGLGGVSYSHMHSSYYHYMKATSQLHARADFTPEGARVLLKCDGTR